VADEAVLNIVHKKKSKKSPFKKKVRGPMITDLTGFVGTV
jgi:hypothetical protein